VRALGALLAIAACDAYDVPPARIECTSGELRPGTSESEEMTPGQACNACHAQSNASSGDSADAPIYAFAGTAYVGAHEPDDCVGGPIDTADAHTARALIEIVSRTGVHYRAPINDVGNFMLEADDVAFPITARITYEGRTRWMIEPMKSGDCNTCHDADGHHGAPGRIRLP